MATAQLLPFLYSCVGGMTPETLEVFWVRPDGISEYVAGNSWPYQAPFDEIGHYRGPLRAEELDSLWRLASEAQRTHPVAAALVRSLDAGAEFFRAHFDGAAIEGEWDATRIPDGYAPLVRQIRDLIARARDFPSSTLRVSWLQPDIPDQELGLEWQNRGGEPFLFYDLQQADEEMRLSIRARCARLDTTRPPAPPNPLSLVRLQPLALANPSDWQPGANGQMVLEPGQTLRIEIPRGALRLEAGTLECLIRVSFFRVTPDGGHLLEQGWAMPSPLALKKNWL